MSNRSYTPKPRPNTNFLTSELMDGILCGGGAHSPIQREAYWIPSQEDQRDIILDDLPLPLKKL